MALVNENVVKHSYFYKAIYDILFVFSVIFYTKIKHAKNVL